MGSRCNSVVLFDVLLLSRLNPKLEICRVQDGRFRKVLEAVHNTTQWFLNRPNIQKLREIDEKVYVVLSIQSFKRGLPMMPCSREPLVTIDAGQRLGLPHWRRYKTQQEHNPRKRRFHLVEYVKILLNAIGEDIEAFDTLDGRELVSYQCVVRRTDWELLRSLHYIILKL